MIPDKKIVLATQQMLFRAYMYIFDSGLEEFGYSISLSRENKLVTIQIHNKFISKA